MIGRWFFNMYLSSGCSSSRRRSGRWLGRRSRVLDDVF
jgi:hypothetical protein